MLSTIVLELPPLQMVMCLARPSASIKTPYIADLISLKKYPDVINEFTALNLQPSSSTSSSSPSRKQQLLSQKENIAKMRDKYTTILGHAPSLDCAGMVIPGSRVFVSESTSEKTKSKVTIQQCEEIREDGTMTRVGYHPFIAERVAKKLLEDHLLDGDLDTYESILSQQTYGNSRVDFVLLPPTQSLESSGRTKRKKSATSLEEQIVTLLEVKNVVGADYPKGNVPSARSLIGTYESTLSLHEGYRRAAIFPHGSTNAVGVVSDRAIKHIHELTSLHGTFDESGRKIQSAILFIINRGDVEYFRPCHEADMLFAQILHRAKNKGVKLIAKKLHWNEEVAYLGETLPIVFDEKVINEIDISDNHLARVLAYNESNQRKTETKSFRQTVSKEKAKKKQRQRRK